MSARWEQKLQQFQRSLEAFRNFVGIDLYYAVVHIRGPQLAPNDRATPLVYASGGTLFDTLTLPITAEEHQLHLLFGMDHAPAREDVLRNFKSQLRDLHDLFPLIPQRVLTSSTLPAMANGGDENFVRWGLALIWLGAREQKVFQSEVEFAESASSFGINGRVSPWEKLSPVPGFDPIELVTQTGKPDKGWAHWNQEHTKAGRTFPEVLAVSLTKPIFYASVNAVDLLIQIGLEQRPKSNTKRIPTRVTRGGTKLTGADLLVIAALRKHHQGADGPNFTPLIEDEIADLAGVSQSSASRTLKKHLGCLQTCRGLSGDKCYEKLCKEGIILAILDNIENPRTREEITNARWDHFAGEDDQDDD